MGYNHDRLAERRSSVSANAIGKNNANITIGTGYDVRLNHRAQLRRIISSFDHIGHHVHVLRLQLIDFTYVATNQLSPHLHPPKGAYLGQTRIQKNWVVPYKHALH